MTASMKEIGVMGGGKTVSRGTQVGFSIIRFSCSSCCLAGMDLVGGLIQMVTCTRALSYTMLVVSWI